MHRLEHSEARDHTTKRAGKGDGSALYFYPYPTPFLGIPPAPGLASLRSIMSDV